MLTINGFDFPDAKAIQPSTTWTSLRNPLNRAKPRVARTNLDAHNLTLQFVVKGEDCHFEKEQLQGLMQQGQVLVVTSDTQRFWGESRTVIVTCLSFDFSEEAPFYYVGTATCEFRGNPQNNHMVYDVSSVQDFNDYELPGITTIGLPKGTVTAIDPDDGTNFAVTTRGTDPIITNYDGLDSGVYEENEVTQTSIEFQYDPLQGHDNAVYVKDGDDFITNVDHIFSTDFTIENSIVSISSDIDDNAIVMTVGGIERERFSIDGGLDLSAVRLLSLQSEYVALLVDGLVLELFRSRDLVITVLRGTLVYLDAAATVQNTGAGDNALQLGASGVYVSSNAFFKTTAGREITVQTGADPNPSDVTVPRYQIFVPSADLATRKLEVLKRQN